MTDDRPARYFTDPQQWRGWLTDRHRTDAELWVGFWKGHAKRPTITWPESVRQALCFGWIDGLRQSVDDDRYRIRFTPRKATSIWSTVNLELFETLRSEGLMMPAGEAAYADRREGKQGIYAYENEARELPEEYAVRLAADREAFVFWESTRPSYRKVAIHWVVSAKREETREKRMAELLEECRAGRLIKSQRYGR